MNYAEKVKKILDDRGWNIPAMAAKTGIPRATLYALVDGKSQDMRSAINRAVVDSLLEGEK